MAANDTMLVQLTTGQLQALVRAAVVDALGELEGLAANRAPALLDRSGLARELGFSVSTVDKLRADGCPHVRVGDVPRFELPTVLAWLRNREASAVQAGAPPNEVAENMPVRRALG